MENPANLEMPPTIGDVIAESRALTRLIIRWMNALPWARKLTKKQLDILIYSIYGLLIFLYLKYLLTYGIYPPFLWGRYFWESLVIIGGSIWVLAYWHRQSKQPNTSN